MNRLLRLCLIVMLMAPIAKAGAQELKHERKRDRQEWFQKMKEFKHAYLIKELDLSKKQAEDFFQVYDAMEKERFDAERKVREMERKIIKAGAGATDEEIDQCIAEQYKLNRTMADIDARYESSFRKMLTRRQLMKLPHVEREFQRVLIDCRKDSRPPKPQP